jgi:predicted esterase
MLVRERRVFQDSSMSHRKGSLLSLVLTLGGVVVSRGTVSPPASAHSAVQASEVPSVAPAPSASAPAPARSLGTLSFPGGEAAYYAPAEDGPRPVTIFLHGMCATGRLECPVFSAASRSGWLLCPDGSVGCQGGGWMWASMAKEAEARLQAATDALRAKEAGRVGAGPMAIVGYSLGAPVALLQAIREPGRYDRLMIVNASVEPAAATMKKAGLKRVALVAGAKDATASKLRAAAQRLVAAGVDARYFVLEGTGHYFDGQSEARMAEPLGWLLGP